MKSKTWRGENTHTKYTCATELLIFLHHACVLRRQGVTTTKSSEPLLVRSPANTLLAFTPICLPISLKIQVTRQISDCKTLCVYRRPNVQACIWVYSSKFYLVLVSQSTEYEKSCSSYKLKVLISKFKEYNIYGLNRSQFEWNVCIKKFNSICCSDTWLKCNCKKNTGC
jgi:hypothetical protein